ncbi:MAG TPA: polyprenyl synthetase family protein [Acidimicrobiales bacterium]|nr:polyprenyl synthetase family protein [Acidimicrobiales bacterium]
MLLYGGGVNPHERLRLASVETDLAQLETLLADSVIFGDAYLDSVTTHLIYAGGKRLRPILAVASATGGERRATRDDLMGGVALELMHLASLYHDDVMDEAVVRRNVDSVNARYGNLIAIVAGDYLMARSAAIAADLGTEVAGLLARTLAWLTRGQVSEVRTAYSTARSEQDYFEAIEGKTASLMSSSCRVGALTAHLPLDQTEGLSEFGRCFGMIYQLRDDVLDLTATENQLGKPAGQDLAEGIYNLPTLFALADDKVGDELHALLGRPLSDDERERARKLVVATDAIEHTVDAATSYLTLAKTSLEVVPSAALQEGFTSLIESLLDDLVV